MISGGAETLKLKYLLVKPDLLLKVTLFRRPCAKVSWKLGEETEFCGGLAKGSDGWSNTSSHYYCSHHLAHIFLSCVQKKCQQKPCFTSFVLFSLFLKCHSSLSKSDFYHFIYTASRDLNVYMYFFRTQIMKRMIFS